MADRKTGGISGSGGSNVNPLYRPFKAVIESVNRYAENNSEAYMQTKTAEKD